MSSKSPSNTRSKDIPLRRLNSHVFVLDGQPMSGESTSSKNGPSLILLYGWMDSQYAHLVKYVSTMHSLFPNSKIVLICSTGSWLFSSQRHLDSLFKPVADILREEVASPSFSGILLHVISNGGGFNLVSLRKLLAKTKSSTYPGGAAVSDPSFPVALVLDSTPGNDGLKTVLTDMAPANPTLYVVSAPIFAVVHGIYHLLYTTVARNPPIFTELRATLNDPNLLPIITDDKDELHEIPRLYIYSLSDKNTLPHNVEAHIKDAKARGFDVTVERYSDSLHVSHARKDPQKYWGAVHNLWLRAVGLAERSKAPRAAL